MASFKLTDIWILPKTSINLMLTTNNLNISGNSIIDRYTLTKILADNRMIVDPNNIVTNPMFKDLYIANDNELYTYAKNALPGNQVSASTPRFDLIESIILRQPLNSRDLSLEDIWVLPETSIKAMLESNGKNYTDNNLLNLYEVTSLFAGTPLLSQPSKEVFNKTRFRELYLSSDDQLITELSQHPELIQPNALSTHFNLIKSLIDIPAVDSNHSVKRRSSFGPELYPEDQNLTNWKLVRSSELDDEEKNCSICICPLRVGSSDADDTDDVVVRLGKCGGHHFHRECIRQCKQGTGNNGYIKCPICNILYGIRRGNQPDGTMTIYTIDRKCPGLQSCKKIIVMNFKIPDGIQGSDHQNPGSSYKGTNRVGYLPDTPEGREVLRKFETAWERKLLFTIGKSLTSGLNNVVIYAGIHMKTSICAGAHGYPDPTYLDRVSQELADKGVL